MKLNDLATRIHKQALDMGWWENKRSELEIHMLIVSEIAEATEAVRNSEPAHYTDNSGKPEGEAVELADALIRILDYAAYRSWDLESIIEKKLTFNKSRGHRHGGKAL